MIPVVVGSSPIGHPIHPPQKWQAPRSRAGVSAGEAFVAGVGAAVAQIRANSHGAALGRDPEHLHQLRIGIRRLRSTLRAFRELVRRKRSAKFDRQLRADLHALGAARDWDLFLGAHDSTDRRYRTRPGAAAARRRMRAILGSAGFRALPSRVLAWSRSAPWRSGADPGEPLQSFARRALDRLRRGLEAAVEDIDWSDAARRHRVRIRVKRLRYGCDCFTAAWTERDVRPFLETLHRLQAILGDLNDICVQRGLLRAYPHTIPAAASAESALRLRERALAANLAQAWTGFERIRPFWRRREAARA